MPARPVNQRNSWQALLMDARFNHPEANALAAKYLPRLVTITRNKAGRQIGYVDILRLQITLGLEALANGYPHLPETDDTREARRSLRRMLQKQERELGRLPLISHENIEQGNMASILSAPAVKRLRDQDWAMTYGELIEIDPGCVLVVLTAYWTNG